MNEGYYNTYTISDSDISIADDSPKNEISCKDNDCVSTSEEPEFFQQVIQRVRFEFNEFFTTIANVKLLLIMCLFLAKTKKIVISKNSYTSKRPCTGRCPD